MRGWIGVVLVVAMAGGRAWGEGAKVPFTVGKETTVLVGPLRADGAVDYVGAINEKYGKGVKAAGNGYVAWLEATGTQDVPPAVLAMCGGHRVEDAILPDGTEIYKWYQQGHRHMTGPMPEKFADFFAKVGPFLDRTSAAAAMEKWWVPLATDGNGFAVIPPRGWESTALGLSEVRAQWRWEHGDFEGFLADIATVKRLEKLTDRPIMAISVTSATCELDLGILVGRAAGGGKMTAAQCGRLAAILDGWSPRSMAEWEEDEGRWLILYRLERMALGNEPAWRAEDNAVVEFPAPMRQQVDWDVVLKRANALIDARVAALKDDSLSAREASAKRWREASKRRKPSMLERLPSEDREAYSERLAGVLLADRMEGEWIIDNMMRSWRMYGEMGRTVVAAAAYKADRGDWPLRLGDLVPRYLKAVPRDMYADDGKGEVGYVLREGGIEVYSVWENKRDDGGEWGEYMNDVGVGVLSEEIEP
jgi:hypothetical protein